jgi:hypothetical protein
VELDNPLCNNTGMGQHRYGYSFCSKIDIKLVAGIKSEAVAD